MDFLCDGYTCTYIYMYLFEVCAIYRMCRPSVGLSTRHAFILTAAVMYHSRTKNVLELLDKNYHIHASLNSVVSCVTHGVSCVTHEIVLVLWCLLTQSPLILLSDSARHQHVMASVIVYVPCVLHPTAFSKSA